MNQHLFGIFQVILSGICFGFLGLFGKYLFEKNVSAGELLALRFSIGGIVMLLYFLLSNKARLKIPFKKFLACCFLGILGYACFSSMFFLALGGLSISLTVLLLYTYPLIVVVAGFLFFKRKVPLQRLWLIPLVMGGVFLLVASDFSALPLQSLMFGLGAALFYAFYILFAESWLQDTDAFVASCYIQLSAGCALILLKLNDAERILNIFKVAWLEVLIVALVCSVAAISLFLSGLRYLKSWEVSLLSTTEPLVSIFLAWMMFGEKLSSAQILGAVFILSAFVFLALAEHKRKTILRNTRC